MSTVITAIGHFNFHGDPDYLVNIAQSDPTAWLDVTDNNGASAYIPVSTVIGVYSSNNNKEQA